MSMKILIDDRIENFDHIWYESLELMPEGFNEDIVTIEANGLDTRQVSNWNGVRGDHDNMY